MKKYLLIGLAAVGMLSLTSCEDFLDSTNYTEANTDNYPAAAADLNKELSSLYGVMNQLNHYPLECPWFVWNVMSDDTNGAGGTGDVTPHAIGHLMQNQENLYTNAWHCIYVGISRASAIIYSVDSFDWTGNETKRDQLLGEAYFMRGLFYLWGTQFWGDIPAYWGAAAPDPCPQQSAEEVIFPHILADFTSAYNLMTNGATTWGDGHAMKGAAAGYLARAYMFYQGFYKKAGELATANLADVELPEQEGVNGPLTKAFVVSALEDCIQKSGAELIPDFRCLWQYTNDLTAPGYAYTQDLAASNTFWAGNGNKEQLFQIQFTNAASYNGTIQMGFINQTALYLGLRVDKDFNNRGNGGADSLPYGQGWGMGVFNMNAVNEWPDSDPRKKATVLNCEEELAYFAYTTSCSEETGMYNKKWMPVTCDESSFGVKEDEKDGPGTGPYTWWGVYRTQHGNTPNSNGNSMQGDHFTDIVFLRLADVMLMHSELTGDATYLNKVQERAGVRTTPYSWENIRNERRWELFGEGIRFNDLRRWSGNDGGETCLAALALERQNGSRVNYTGNWTTMHHASSSWAQRYAKTNGFLPKPEGQINIANDESVLKQNPGWGSDASDWNMTGTPVY
ncbi:MAG: RagB/SusD family nutrient uptake outer membrane protein [Muribaculaceae bacterium]|nr:RagB/SusD family nutrient uptake outer membrane protein [Muribaculaceae bacterium]